MRSATSTSGSPHSTAIPSAENSWGCGRTACSARWTIPDYVAVDLEFDTPAEAERCKVALGELWRSKQAAPALRGAPQVRIVETVESVQY